MVAVLLCAYNQTGIIKHSPTHQEKNMSSLDAFARQQYLNLETFRKSGVPVRTPVWFTQDGDLLYVITESGSGKVKRIRNNGRVNLVPCKVDGTPLADWLPGAARLVSDEATIRKAERLQNQKYGWFGRLLSLPQKVKGAKTTVLEIRLAE